MSLQMSFLLIVSRLKPSVHFRWSGKLIVLCSMLVLVQNSTKFQCGTPCRGWQQWWSGKLRSTSDIFHKGGHYGKPSFIFSQLRNWTKSMKHGRVSIAYTDTIQWIDFSRDWVMCGWYQVSLVWHKQQPQSLLLSPFIDTIWSESLI